MRTTPSAHEKSGECKHKDYEGKKNLQGTEMHATNPPHLQGDRPHSGNDHTRPKPTLPHHPEQVVRWALRRETAGKGGRKEMEVPVCYLQRASQWLVSVRLAGKER